MGTPKRDFAVVLEDPRSALSLANGPVAMPCGRVHLSEAEGDLLSFVPEGWLPGHWAAGKA